MTLTQPVASRRFPFVESGIGKRGGAQASVLATIPDSTLQTGFQTSSRRKRPLTKEVSVNPT